MQEEQLQTFLLLRYIVFLYLKVTIKKEWIVAQWMEHLTANQTVVVRFPVGTCLGCRPGPQ